MNKIKQIAVEKTAIRAREACQVTDYGVQDIFESAVKLGFELIRYPIGENEFLGFSEIKEDGKIIFTNSSIILSREIFSVAHELGHHYLHLSLDGITFIKDNDFSEYDEKEVEANYFAVCFLMPEEKVRAFIHYEMDDKNASLWNGLDIALLQSAFNTSYDAVLARLSSLGIIDKPTLNNLRKEKIANSTFRFLKAIDGNTDLNKAVNMKKIPAEYLRWVIENFNEKLISYEDLNSILQYIDLDGEEIGIDFDNTEDDEESIDTLLGGIE